MPSEVYLVKFEALKEKVQKNPIFGLIIIIGITIAFLAGIISNITTIESFIEKNPALSVIIFVGAILVLLVIIISSIFFQKRALSKKVGELTPGVNINVYRDKFGEPIFINPNEEKKTREYVFIHPYFYLDAIADMNDAVQYF